MLSKALVVGAYQQKLVEIARHGEIDLTAVAPPSWRDGAAERFIEQREASGYRLIVSPIAANGNFHLFFFPQLPKILDDCQPDLLHVEEEAYNLATFLAVWHARRRRIPSVFFTWQNIARRYPLPFRLMERYVYRNVGCAIAGTRSAERVLRGKGYRGVVRVIPQFGVDPTVFSPAPEHPESSGADGGVITIGFAGRLVPEKGVEVLVDACARLDRPYRLVILGNGPALPSIRARIRQYGIEDLVDIRNAIDSREMPQFLRSLDVLVLPSLTRPNWAEQFGRVLIEAMACGTPIIGSSCGEIPDVVGDAGLIVPEGNASAIAEAVMRLAKDGRLRADLIQLGRRRALERFTHARVAQDTVDLYLACAKA